MTAKKPAGGSPQLSEDIKATINYKTMGQRIKTIFDVCERAGLKLDTDDRAFLSGAIAYQLDEYATQEKQKFYNSLMETAEKIAAQNPVRGKK